MKKLTLILTEQEALACVMTARTNKIEPGDELMLYHLGKKIKELLEQAGKDGRLILTVGGDENEDSV